MCCSSTCPPPLRSRLHFASVSSAAGCVVHVGPGDEEQEPHEEATGRARSPRTRAGPRRRLPSSPRRSRRARPGSRGSGRSRRRRRRQHQTRRRRSRRPRTRAPSHQRPLGRLATPRGSQRGRRWLTTTAVGGEMLKAPRREPTTKPTLLQRQHPDASLSFSSRRRSVLRRSRDQRADSLVLPGQPQAPGAFRWAGWRGSSGCGGFSSTSTVFPNGPRRSSRGTRILTTSQASPLSRTTRLCVLRSGASLLSWAASASASSRVIERAYSAPE